MCSVAIDVAIAKFSDGRVSGVDPKVRLRFFRCVIILQVFSENAKLREASLTYAPRAVEATTRSLRNYGAAQSCACIAQTTPLCVSSSMVVWANARRSKLPVLSRVRTSSAPTQDCVFASTAECRSVNVFATPPGSPPTSISAPPCTLR